MLIIFSGLPGAGKTTLAKKLAEKTNAVYIRIDTIEQAILSSIRNIKDIAETGYIIGYGLAEDNLKNGLTVIADSVNPIEITRQAWLNIAKNSGKKSLEVEIICSDATEHKTRVENRISDITGHKLPNWKEIQEREYNPWKREHLIVDTAGKNIEQCVNEIFTQIKSK